MRNFFTLLVASAVLFAIYAGVFGLPERVAMMMNVNASVETSAQAPRGQSAAQSPGPRGGGRATTVVTQALTLQPYETVLNAIGSATSLRSADVIAGAAGEVTEVNLRANTSVAQGDVLVRLDSRSAKLNLEIAQALLDQALETVARYERLRAGGNSTVTDVALSEAEIAKRLAQANLGLAQAALDDRTIRAPIEGKLGLSDIEIGDVLVASDAIVSIDDDEALLVTFELPERAIGILATTSNVVASTPTFTGRLFNGEVVSFDSRLDSVTRSVTVKARIENENAELWPGMTFSVRMMHNTQPLPTVPSTAIVWSRAGSSIWVDKNGLATQVPVTILYRVDNTVWIEGAVAEGDLVVTEGAHKLRQGSTVVSASMVAK